MRLPDERHAESQPVSSHKNNKSSFPLGVEFSCCISRALRHVSKAEKVQDHSYIVCSTWQLVGFHLHHALLKWALSHSLQQRLSFLHRQDEILQWHTLRSAVQIRSAAVHWEKSSDTSNLLFISGDVINGMPGKKKWMLASLKEFGKKVLILGCREVKCSLLGIL